MWAGHFCVNHSNHGSHDHVLAILELEFLRQYPCFRLSATITHDFLFYVHFDKLWTNTHQRSKADWGDIVIIHSRLSQLWLIVDYCIWLAQILPKIPSQHLDISPDPDCVLSWLRALITVILRQWYVHYGENRGVPLPPVDNGIRVSTKGIDQRYLAKIWIIQGWLKKVASRPIVTRTAWLAHCSPELCSLHCKNIEPFDSLHLFRYAFLRIPPWRRLHAAFRNYLAELPFNCKEVFGRNAFR